MRVLSTTALSLISAALLISSIDGGKHNKKQQKQQQQHREVAQGTKAPKQTWDQIWKGCPQIFWDTYFIPNNKYRWGATNRIRVRMTSYEKDVVEGYRVGLSLPKNAHVYWHDSQAIGKPNALVDGQTPFFDVGKNTIFWDLNSIPPKSKAQFDFFIDFDTCANKTLSFQGLGNWLNTTSGTRVCQKLASSRAVASFANPNKKYSNKKPAPLPPTTCLGSTYDYGTKPDNKQHLTNLQGDAVAEDDDLHQYKQ